MGKSGAENFFTAAELGRISQAVNAAETVTSGEIATVIVEESDSYREAGLLGTFFLSGLLALVVVVATGHVMVWSFIPLLLLFYFPIRLLFFRFPRLKLPFVGRKRLEEAVRERAVRAFYEKGLYRTREETGILLFISILEHKVWILGDRGINSIIPDESWSKLAAELAAGIRAGRPCDALCHVITQCGDVLSRSFPRKPDDVNELTDDVQLG